MKKVVTVVQARSGSTRFPQKVMQDLYGLPVLIRQLERISRAKQVGTIVVATTTDPQDDALAALAQRHGYAVYRGHPTNLLERHFQAALLFDADLVVKIPSDCPLIDPEVIDLVIGTALLGNFDYCSNLHPASYPDGNDVEVMSFAALSIAREEAIKDFEKEHTTPFLWERPERFRLHNVVWPRALNLSMTHRLTLDYPEDLDLIRAVFEGLYPLHPRFAMADVIDYLTEFPHIFALNQKYAGVNWYRHHLHELSTITASETKLEYSHVSHA